MGSRTELHDFERHVELGKLATFESTAAGRGDPSGGRESALNAATYRNTHGVQKATSTTDGDVWTPAGGVEVNVAWPGRSRACEPCFVALQPLCVVTS